MLLTVCDYLVFIYLYSHSIIVRKNEINFLLNLLTMVDNKLAQIRT